MPLFEIPLSSNNQKFNIQLGGSPFKLRFIYRIDAWFVDVLDTSENPLVMGLLMCPGINLLEQYQHILQGAFYVTNSNKDEAQGYLDLGTKIKLYWESVG